MSNVIDRIGLFVREREKISGAPDEVTGTNGHQLLLSDLKIALAEMRRGVYFCLNCQSRYWPAEGSTACPMCKGEVA